MTETARFSKNYLLMGAVFGVLQFAVIIITMALFRGAASFSVEGIWDPTIALILFLVSLPFVVSFFVAAVTAFTFVNEKYELKDVPFIFPQSLFLILIVFGIATGLFFGLSLGDYQALLGFCAYVIGVMWMARYLHKYIIIKTIESLQ